MRQAQYATLANVVSFLFSPLSVTPADAQLQTTIDSRVACARCTITLSRVATLGDSVIPGALSEQPRINAGPDNRFYVYDAAASPGKILVYGPSGRYLTSFGRSGEGPGEYELPGTLIFPTADTIQIVDFTLSRLTTLTSRYRVQRVDRLTVQFIRYARLGNGRLVVNANLRTRANIGYPLHLIDASMRVQRSFGTNTPSLLPRQAYLNNRVLAESDSERFWAAPINNFAVELWDANGTLHRRINRDVAWFRPWTELGSLPRLTPPQSQLAGLYQDQPDRLWAFVHVADANWQPGPAPPADREVPVNRAHAKRYYDTIVEVWDIKANTLIATARLDEYLYGFIQNGFVWTANEDALGNPRYHIWRMNLNQPGR